MNAWMTICVGLNMVASRIGRYYSSSSLPSPERVSLPSTHLADCAGDGDQPPYRSERMNGALPNRAIAPRAGIIEVEAIEDARALVRDFTKKYAIPTCSVRSGSVGLARA
jgi:hypothetical protein